MLRICLLLAMGSVALATPVGHLANAGEAAATEKAAVCTESGPVAGDPCSLCKCFTPGNCVAVVAECTWDQRHAEYVSQGCTPAYAAGVCCPKVVCPPGSEPAASTVVQVNSTQLPEASNAVRESSNAGSEVAAEAGPAAEESAPAEGAGVEAAFFAEAAAEEAVAQAGVDPALTISDLVQPSDPAVVEELKASAALEPISEELLLPAEPASSAFTQEAAVDHLQSGPAETASGISLSAIQSDMQILEAEPVLAELGRDLLQEGSGDTDAFIDLVIDSGLLQDGTGLFEGSGNALF